MSNLRGESERVLSAFENEEDRTLSHSPLSIMDIKYLPRQN